MAGGRFWTTLEERELARLIDTGLKYAVVAKRLNRSLSSVRQRVDMHKRKAGIPVFPRLHKKGELENWVRKLCIVGVPDSAVANILGVTRSAIMKCRQRIGVSSGCEQHKKPIAPERAIGSTRAKVIRLYAGVGRSDTEIARILNVHLSSVWRIRKRLGLQNLGTTCKDNNNGSD